MTSGFDYLIVGGGSAGCVVTNRLIQSKVGTVGLLEAGGKDRNPWIHIPVGYFKTMGNPRTDWCYKTQPIPGLNGRSIDWPRGKTLGGSSSINGLLYVRGQPQDYNHWRQLGNAGWSWNDIKPLFKKLENWEGGDDEVRGTGGPLSVSKNRVDREIVTALIRSGVAAGYPWTEDYNQENQEGFGFFQMTIENGMRCSAAKAYLKPILKNSDLSIITNIQVSKIFFDGKKAVGVEATVNGELKTIWAKKEVILCTGAIGSPQLLMLSGVGSASNLKKHGIEVVSDLPGVGQNLQDHLQARPAFKTSAGTINLDARNPIKKLGMAMEYLINRTGPMAMAASLGTGFIKTRDNLETPDIQYHIQPFSADKIAEGPHKFSAFTASVCQLRPESRGHIELSSANPQDHPKIFPNYLSSQTDKDTMVSGVQITRAICEKEPVASLITEEYSPGSEVGRDDYDGILEWIRDNSTTIYHPVGTCKMGQDPMAVVDERLKVKGFENLRVVDASIMPTITSGNTNAPSIMIGEKGSELILNDAAKR